MAIPVVLLTERLVLRPWRDEDLDAFAALNADRNVREHFPSVLSRAQSDASAARIRAAMERDGFGLWAVEVIGGTRFIGFIGLDSPSFEAHFTPCTEIGWRLAYASWGHGYATEGAQAALDFAFDRLGLAEVVSMTTPANHRSRRVMEKLGMRRDPGDDFDHPLLPPESPFRRHVLYRLDALTHERTSPSGGRRVGQKDFPIRRLTIGAQGCSVDSWPQPQECISRNDAPALAATLTPPRSCFS